MKVYVVTRGEYSDYHICKITDDPYAAVIIAQEIMCEKPFDDDDDYIDNTVRIEEYETSDIQTDIEIIKNNQLVYSAKQYISSRTFQPTGEGIIELDLMTIFAGLFVMMKVFLLKIAIATE